MRVKFQIIHDNDNYLRKSAKHTTNSRLIRIYVTGNMSHMLSLISKEKYYKQNKNDALGGVCMCVRRLTLSLDL